MGMIDGWMWLYIFQTEERHRYHLEKLYQEFIRTDYYDVFIC